MFMITREKAVASRYPMPSPVHSTGTLPKFQAPFTCALLLAAICLAPALRCVALNAHNQTPAGTTMATGQVSKEAADLILQGFDRLGQQDATGAEMAFRQAIAIQPEVEPAHRGLGLALREQGRLPEAFRELQTATQLNPSDADAHFALGSVAWTLSNPSAAIPGRKGGLTASDYQNLADLEFNKSLSLNPKDSMLRVNLAVLYLDSNRPREALQQAQEAARIAPDSALAHLTLGRCYFANGEEEKAGAEYETAIKIDPQDGDAFFALGQMRMFQRRLPQAEEALRHAIQVSPNLGPAYAALAQKLMAEGKNAEARGLLEKAVTLNSQDWQSQYQLAVLLNQAGETVRATDLLRKVLQANPDFPGAREQLATGLLRREDVQDATDLASKMIAEDPHGPEGHRIMALAYWKQRDFDGALSECALALNADPNSGSMLVLQAIALWQIGNKKNAQKAFRDAAKVEPKVGTADVFCRLLLCDARDINIVSEFLHKNRWLLLPPTEP